MEISAAARFWAKVKKSSSHECWLWQARLVRSGHGSFWFNGKTRTAHVFSWMLAHDKRPNMHILHKCGKAACVNPQHLYEGTQKQNIQDSVAHGTHHQSAKKACHKGHPFSSENTRRGVMGRSCRKCDAERSRRYRSERKSKSIS